MVSLATNVPLLGYLDEKQGKDFDLLSIVDPASDSPNKSDASIASDPEETESQVMKFHQPDSKAQRAAFDQFVKHSTDQHDSGNTPRTPLQKQAAEESARIIDKARDYQQELFERAKGENVIAVLDTGSGKTLISCLLIKHILTQEFTDRAQGIAPRIVVFLANSVHLVQQQARVLTSNLIVAPVVFIGSDKAELWKSQEHWSQLLLEGIPVVCTPAILQQCLDGAMIKIAQISLLVFDEAHHAKKNHPYSMIIRSYYLKCPAKQRPRIFGMTASPVDSKGNIDANTADLEQLLDSKIITTSDLSILSFAPKPVDVIWKYSKLCSPCETELHQRLWPLCGFSAELKKSFEFSRKAVSELGPWCADYVLRHVFGDSTHEAASLVKRYEQSKAYGLLDTLEKREDAIQKLERACSLVRTHNFEDLTPDHVHLSSKVLHLYEELRGRYAADPNTRTIVFLEQRLTALMLNECFQRLLIPNLRTGVLLGTAMESTSLKRQEQVLDHFRAGLTNLVFATSVADEGIDIPQCNLCIRFDLYKTPIQYTQSRGRARMTGSTYVHMVQEDDRVQEHMVKYAMDCDTYVKAFCQGLPSDRLLGQGTKLDRLISKDSANRSFKTAVGAVCDFGNSLMILARFATSLNYLGALDKESYEEEIDIENKQFRYIVRLPPCSETQVKGARGDWRQNKQLAKRSAAFNCCYLLRQKGMLNENLYSIFQKVKPENLNAHLAVSAKTSSYPMQSKPTAWTRDIGEIPDVLFASVLRFSPEKELQQPLSPLAVLTRSRLPAMPSFPLFLDENIRTDVIIEPISQVLHVSTEDVMALTKFTLDGIFRDVFNKKYQLDPSKMAYWLAPLSKIHSSETPTLSSIVDLDAVRLVDLGRIKWTTGAQADGIWTNKFIHDPRSGKHHYYTSDVVHGASIFDPIPESVPLRHKKRRKNIIDFSDNSWRASKKNFIQSLYDPAQPILAAKLLVTRRNFLDRADGSERSLVECRIAPQPLEVSRLSPSLAAAAFLWPTIIHRVESYMIVLEAFERLSLSGVPASLALEAFSKDGDVDEENTQTHFATERGMGKNYERLEFIGDSLLKMMTTITVFNRTKCDEEGMHCRRMEILCNRRLFDVATEKHHLYRYARTTAFNTTTWYPEDLVLLEGRGARQEPVKHPELSQDLGMKTIADISEAIIGAAVSASRNAPNPLDLGIKAITILVDSEDHAINSWAEIGSMYQPPEWSLLKNDVQANKLAKDVEARTGYKFNHPRLLRSAFTHSSDMNATVPDLQRLEFLGDAVLDWACISWLFETNPDRNPQWLTEHKMAMVSNKFLAALAVVLDFDKFIYCSTTKLFADITDYARKVRDLRFNKEVPRDFWTKIDSPPKTLSDLVESYLGALLVDSNWNYAEIEQFFTNHVLWFFEDISQYDTFANRHPTSFLYKKFHDEYKCRDFRILSSDPAEGQIEVSITAGIVVHGRVVAHSKGSSSKYAKVRASKIALELVEGLSKEEFREKFGCTCKGGSD